MNTIIERIHNIGIIPVISLSTRINAVQLANALSNGGLPIAEVKFSFDTAQDLILEMKKACPEMLIGAGSVSTSEQINLALDAGAEFIISCGLDPDIIKLCQKKNVPVIPEISNTENIETAVALGIDTLKIFLDETPGKIKMFKNYYSSPFEKIKFIIAGNIEESQINKYLNEACILAFSESRMIDEEAIVENNFEKIEELTKNTVNTVLGRTIKHIGINEENGNGAALAVQFAGIFGGRVRKTFKGWFGSEYAEIMSKKFITGTHGHIGIGVNDPERARRYYEALGFSFDENTAGYDENGDLEIIYFSGEIGGFALHIVKK